MLGKQAKILTPKQQEVFLNYLRTTEQPERNVVMALLTFRAGLRPIEIAGSTWEMIFTSTGEIGNEIHLPNLISKGRTGGRIIALHPELRKALVALYEQQRPESPEDRIIQTRRSKRTTAQVIVNFFYTHYKKIGFLGCSSYSGRRTFATSAGKQLSKVGASMKDLQILMGHKSIRTTSLYIEVDTDAQRKLVNIL